MGLFTPACLLAALPYVGTGVLEKTVNPVKSDLHG